MPMSKARSNSKSLFKNGAMNRGYASWKRSDGGLRAKKTKDKGISYRELWEADQSGLPFDEWVRRRLPDTLA